MWARRRGKVRSEGGSSRGCSVSTSLPSDSSCTLLCLSACSHWFSVPPGSPGMSRFSLHWEEQSSYLQSLNSHTFVALKILPYIKGTFISYSSSVLFSFLPPFFLSSCPSLPPFSFLFYLFSFKMYVLGPCSLTWLLWFRDVVRKESAGHWHFRVRTSEDLSCNKEHTVLCYSFACGPKGCCDTWSSYIYVVGVSGWGVPKSCDST